MSKIKDDVLKLRAQAKAARYLSLKQYQLEQRKHQKMDNVTMFVLGIAVAVIVAIGTQLYILGAL
tara:strand:+ start:1852 stop:2046 length:195 start_codon:yes stop_codon:yes gene_type:complete